MKRTMTRVACLLALTAAPVVAQNTGVKPGADAGAVEKFAGQWEGSFATDHTPPGVLRMTFAKDSAWKVTLELLMDQPIASERVADFRIDGNKLTWTHPLMGGTCKSVAVHDAGTIKGEATCDHGAYTFTLVKK